RESLDSARAQLAAPCLLCPDMAFALGPLPRPDGHLPDVDIVWLARTDAESQGDDFSPRPDAEVVARLDWLEEPATALRESKDALSRRLESCGPDDWPALLDSVMRTYGPLAGERLERGCKILARGRVVITDRLHGHILCLPLGIRHVLLDNNYRKL